MIKFSIIIPVYNVGKYLKQCFNSILKQKYNNYEVIIVCDKCTDNSEDIVDKYVKENKNFKKIYKENTGLSLARNYGLKEAKGDYILFLDSDDYLEPTLLETLEKELKDAPDILRFQVQDLIDNEVIQRNEQPFSTTSGIKAFSKISKYHYIENAWCYTYKTSFWKNNDFKFMPNCIAEDYGLTPLVIASAKTVKSINYIGYNYRQRKNSLMNNTNYSQKIKKMDDMLLQATFLKGKLKSVKNNEELMRFINNSLIYFSTTLNKKDYKKYNRILKEYKCFDYLPNKIFKDKVKKTIIKTSPWFFYHYLVR